jgi:membrane associated rhomboid family serine protease
MSIYDRDYIRESGSSANSGGPSRWSVVTWLLMVNVAVFVVNNLFFFNPERDLFGLSMRSLESLRLWTPITYQFVHASPWHLLGNMLGLFFLGRILLGMTTPRQVVRLYLLGGLGGGILQLFYNALFGPDAVIIGASASVLAIVTAVATLIPRHRITLLLFFIIPVTLTMKQIVYIIIAINVFTLLFSIGAAGSEVAVIAHFGGMLTGWTFVRFGFHRSKSSPRPPRKRAPGVKNERFGIRVIRNEAASGPRDVGGTAPVGKDEPFVTSDVDAILDKINEHGFQSLSDDERGVLEQSSRKLSERIDRKI